MVIIKIKTGIRNINPPMVGTLDFFFMCSFGPSSLIICLAFRDFNNQIKGLPISNEIKSGINNKKR